MSPLPKPTLQHAPGEVAQTSTRRSPISCPRNDQSTRCGTTRSVHQPTSRPSARRPTRRLDHMSVRRVMGTEMEYGISVVGQATGQPDGRVVAGGQRLRLGHGPGPPRALGLRGGVAAARRPGFRHVARRRRSLAAHRRGHGLANVILTNGARLYVDHAHPEYSTPEVTTPLDIVRWDKAGEQVMLDAAKRAAQSRAPDDRALQEQHRQQGLLLRRPRELPDAPLDAVRRHRAPPDAVLRQPPGRHRRGSRRPRPGRARAGLPAQPARRLLRGRGRARDHPQATDHQHPRRAARRPREVPPAARDHRRRQPLGGLDVPQGRHHGAGAGDDRGAVRLGRPQHRRPRRRAAGHLPRPDPPADGHAAGRPPADRRPAAARVPRPGPQVRRGPVRRRRRRPDRRRPGPLGVDARPARARPDAAAPASSTGWPS